MAMIEALSIKIILVLEQQISIHILSHDISFLKIIFSYFIYANKGTFINDVTKLGSGWQSLF